ncbi:uncharacterized protein LOC135942641 [Cloeon dipterum]|uniref:uncharacterized protein LOC135942641 n=1 Tax=Cloeon dipterum TaxID=197152 RepID=UPI00321F7600
MQNNIDLGQDKTEDELAAAEQLIRMVQSAANLVNNQGTSAASSSRRSWDFPVPPFNGTRLDTYFAMLERRFASFGIQDEDTKYMVLCDAVFNYDKLPESVNKWIITQPTNAPYTTLKQSIMESLKPSNYTVIKAKMLTEVWDTNMLPSEFLQRLRTHADEETAKSSIYLADLANVWLCALPKAWQPSLASVAAGDIDVAAKTADNIHRFSSMDAAKSPGSQPPGIFATAAQPNTPEVSAVSNNAGKIDPSVAALIEVVNKLMARLDSDHQGRQQFRGNSRGRGYGRGRGRPRSRSPAELMHEPDLCIYHHKYTMEARRCVPACKYHKQFLAVQKMAEEEGKPENAPGEGK